MATNTPKLTLRKPDTTDLVNVLTDLNDNFDKVDKLSRGELDYVQSIANQGPITVEVDLLTANPITVIAGQRIKIEVTAKFNSSIAGDIVVITIKEGAISLKQATVDLRLAGADYTIETFVRLAPAAGAHTYKMSAQRVVGTGVVTKTANATDPTQILVTDLGQP